jgi:hypothetical protein
MPDDHLSGLFGRGQAEVTHSKRRLIDNRQSRDERNLNRMYPSGRRKSIGPRNPTDSRCAPRASPTEARMNTRQFA